MLLLTDGYSYLTQNTANRTVHTNPTRRASEANCDSSSLASFDVALFLAPSPSVWSPPVAPAMTFENAGDEMGERDGVRGNAVKHFFFRVCSARSLYREAVIFQSPGSRAPRRSRGRPRTLGRIPHITRTPKAFHKNEHGVERFV